MINLYIDIYLFTISSTTFSYKSYAAGSINDIIIPVKLVGVSETDYSILGGLISFYGSSYATYLAFYIKYPLNMADCLGITWSSISTLSSDSVGTYTFSFTNKIVLTLTSGTPSYSNDLVSNYVITAPTTSVDSTTSCKYTTAQFSMSPPA